MTALTDLWARWSNGHDRGLVLAGLALLAAGLVLSLAASPAAAARLDLDGSFALSVRHAGFALLAAVALAACAQADARAVRRIAVALLIASVVALVFVALIGVEKKGARRWLELGALSLQPSEFAKPALVIVCAWMLAERLRRPHFPGLMITAALFCVFAALVAPQPDIGQTALTGAVVLALCALARVDARWLVLGIAVATVAAAGAYAIFEHVRDRVDAFWGAEVVANSQVGRSLGAFASGGLFGQGPGEGTVKLNLPDAHADFVFAVAAEELGLIGALGLMSLYGAIAWIGLTRASRVADPFAQIAASGLILLFSLQAAIHIGVNVAMAPAKGMTLPLVSYGGSSLLASAMTLGLAMALLRDRAHVFVPDPASAPLRWAP